MRSFDSEIVTVVLLAIFGLVFLKSEAAATPLENAWISAPEAITLRSSLSFQSVAFE